MYKAMQSIGIQKETLTAAYSLRLLIFSLLRKQRGLFNIVLLINFILGCYNTSAVGFLAIELHFYIVFLHKRS